MEVAVIGGGAAGLTAAAAAKSGRKDVSVTVYEKCDRVGKKLLSTGNGRCNLTAAAEREDLARFSSHYSEPQFVQGVLERVPPSATDEFFRRMGLVTAVEKSGIYPYSFSANSVLDLFRLHLRALGVKEACGIKITAVQPHGKGYLLKADSGAGYPADRVIVSVGGPAAVSEFDLSPLKSLGHTVGKQYPSLVPLACKSPFLAGLSGLRANVCATLLYEGKPVASECGEVLFRDYGLSGIVIFQLSRYLAEGRSRGREGVYSIALDLFPKLDIGEVLRQKAAQYGSFPCAELFTGVLAKRIGQSVLRQCGIAQEARMDSADLARVAEAAHAVTFTAVEALPFSKAQSSVGSIDLTEIDPHTLRSKLAQNVSVCGEALGISGACGGYNLQWAWSTGLLAGSNGI